MPLVRVEVRNEYGLGAPEMYIEANMDEPKEILEGVAVAGLVGVLRQLGDLADFAAEVFYGLQEEVTIAYSRSHKLMARIQQIEAALVPVEKAVLAQGSHLHFAYTAGSNRHAPTGCEKDRFVYSDVPQFILDSYEECRSPPHFHLLDRFDPGGPGSCLKRYSDPTLFKKASVASGGASPDKVKGLKIKKRRSSPRNKEIPRAASFSYHSGRMRFTRFNVCGKPISTCDATLRSDMSEQSNLDWRNGSCYSKNDFRPSCSMQQEEESRDFISSPSKCHGTDYPDVCDEIQINLSQKQGLCNSYSDTQGDKAAPCKPAMQDYVYDGMTLENDHDRNLELLLPRLDLETLGDNTFNLETVDKLDVQTCSQTSKAFESVAIHLGDFESETDRIRDALNTIEPESETDVSCMRNQDVDHFSKDKAAGDGVHKLVQHNLEWQTPNSDSNISADNSLMKGGCGHEPIAMSSKSHSAACCSSGSPASLIDRALLPAERTGYSNPCGLQSVSSGGNGEINGNTTVEPVSCTVPSKFGDNGSVMSNIGDTISSQESEKSAPETLDVTSVTFWTNGSLLGLQPSKPPDFSAPKDLLQDRLSDKDGDISSSNQHFILSDKDPHKPDKTDSFQNIEEGLDLNSSPADVEIKLGRTGDLLHPNDADSIGASVTASRSSVPVYSEFQAATKHPESIGSSSRIFEPSSRLLTFGSNNRLLHGGYENSMNASRQDVNACEKNHQNFAYRTFSGQTKEFSGGESLIQSPSSSPPLEHMKLAVQPINGFKTSKLKLELLDANTSGESARDIFPSFQLVPEVSVSQKNVGSDSDDDTFSRSSPSLSDDCRSHQSWSNSEQCENSRPLNSKEPDLYDSFHEISLTESVSTVLEKGRTCNGDIHENYEVRFPYVENSMQKSHSCHSFDLQSLETVNHSFQEELRNDIDSKDLVEPEFATAPNPPPQPPVQWWGMNHNLDDAEHCCDVMPKGYKNDFNLKHSASAISQQPKPAPLNHDHIFESTNEQKSKPLGSLKSNGRKEANQGKDIDENDFLHQIQTKLFSLRPTVPVKPTVLSGSSSNVQFTAILEKANAIRQAVGDDDGDDEGSWSDT